MADYSELQSASFELLPVPEFLNGVLSVMRFHRRVGEWDLEMRPPSAALAEQLARLVVAFRWTQIRSVELVSATARVEWAQDHQTESPVEWLARQEAASRDIHGVEATLDLAMSWIDDQQHVGRSMLPGSARWSLDVSSSMQTLTVWPNLFTDEIMLYIASGADRFETRPLAFEKAAELNRSQLAESLRSWEATSGTIVSWDTELVEGIAQYGFEASARPL